MSHGLFYPLPLAERRGDREEEKNSCFTDDVDQKRERRGKKGEVAASLEFIDPWTAPERGGGRRGKMRKGRGEKKRGEAVVLSLNLAPRERKGECRGRGKVCALFI